MRQTAFVTPIRPLLVISLCVLPFLGFWGYGLFDLDEGFYGAVVREMLRTGDWITPHYAGEPWFEKPILVYWLAAPSVALFGDAIGPRLPSILCTLGLAWALYCFGRTRLGEHAEHKARYAAIIWSSSLLAIVIGRMLMTDAAFVLFMSLCLMDFYRSLEGEKGVRWRSGLWLGLAVLAKGPVAGIFFLLVAGLTFWRIKDMRPAFRGGWAMGVLAFVLAVSAWYIPCWLANGDLFVDKFLIEQNIGRFAGGDKAHRVPVWSHPIFFPAVIFLSMGAWIIACLRKDVLKQGDPLTAYLTIWFGVILAFFSISGSKLPHYILPALPPLALILARSKFFEARPNRSMVMACLVATISFAAAHLAASFHYRSEGRALHAVARNLNKVDAPLVIYRLGEGSDTSISLTLNETSRPSILFYYRGPAQVTNDWERALRENPDGFAVLTKETRLGLKEQRLTFAERRGLVRRDDLSREDWIVWQVFARGSGERASASPRP